MTYQELKEKQSWTLNQKVDHALYIIDAFLAQYPNAKVAYSGGIDSTAMLRLARIVKPDIIAVFANTTNEHSEILKFVKDTANVETVFPETNFMKVCESMGFPMISKKTARMIHDVRNPTGKNEASRNLYLTGIKQDGTKSRDFKIPKKFLHLIDVPFEITHKCCDVLKKNPMKKLSKEGILIGTMAENSRTRQGSYLQTGCIDIKNKAAKPMSIFLKDDIWSFVKRENLKYCSVYDDGESNTGCAYCNFGFMFDCDRYKRLFVREPKRHNIMMDIENNGVPYGKAIEIAYKL